MVNYHYQHWHNGNFKNKRLCVIHLEHWKHWKTIMSSNDVKWHCPFPFLCLWKREIKQKHDCTSERLPAKPEKQLCVHSCKKYAVRRSACWSLKTCPSSLHPWCLKTTPKDNTLEATGKTACCFSFTHSRCFLEGFSSCYMFLPPPAL